MGGERAAQSLCVFASVFCACVYGYLCVCVCVDSTRVYLCVSICMCCMGGGRQSKAERNSAVGQRF